LHGDNAENRGPHLYYILHQVAVQRQHETQDIAKMAWAIRKLDIMTEDGCIIFDLVCVCSDALQGNFNIIAKEQAAQH